MQLHRSHTHDAGPNDNPLRKFHDTVVCSMIETAQGSMGTLEGKRGGHSTYRS